MKILLLNNYDLIPIKKEWDIDGESGHQLWGMTQLDRYGIETDILPYRDRKFQFIKKISQKIKILGDLDQQFRVIKQINEYDLIYSGHYFTTSLLSLLRKLKILKQPLISIAFQSPRPNLLMKILSIFVIAGNDKIICLSPEIKEHLIEDFKISPSRLEFIPWGYDTNFHTPPAPINEQKAGYILSTGKSFRDYDTLIQSFKDIDFPLEIIGYSDNILSNLDSIPLNVRLTIPLGAVNQNMDKLVGKQFPANIKIVNKLLTTAQLLSKYKNTYAVAIPLELPDNKPYNTVGLSSLLEAMCMGKAIITTENRDMGINLEREGIGITVPVKDSLAWKQAIQYLLENPAETKEMGEKARYLAEKKYNLDNFTKQIAHCMHTAFCK